ncbi:MAG: sugar phosphate isomerase/epimerase [Clostridia bacterium]|nr:sugar phosphate isomerase/epimerase [Clostridia bacterium]
MKTGIQVSSLKPVLTTEQEVKTAFEKMKAMGCQYVQLQWIDPLVPIGVIADCLQETGIQSVSVQDFYETIRQNKAYYVELNARTGGKWMCVSRIPERLKTRSGLDEYVRELRSFQKELDEVGQQLCFHAVSADFAPIDGIDPVAYLFDAMPELAICADLYHLNKVGIEMNAWLHRYAGRVVMAHFKDKTGFGEQEQLVPAGQGDTDWTDVAVTCRETGVQYGFVEQERWTRDPFDCMKEALSWLDGQLK